MNFRSGDICWRQLQIDRLAYEIVDSIANNSLQVYFDLATGLDDSIVEQVSLEDAHRHNDLDLLECFQRSSVILGSFAIASSEVESVEQIRQRLHLALNHIDTERLIAAPDCGLGLLGRDLAMQKLKAMCEAAKTSKQRSSLYLPVQL